MKKSKLIRKSLKKKQQKRSLKYAFAAIILFIVFSIGLLFYNGAGPLSFLASSASINNIDANCKPGQACWGASLNLLGQFRNSQESKDIAAAQKEIDTARKARKVASNADDIAKAEAAEAAAIAKQKAAETALANSTISKKIEQETGNKIKTADESLAEIKANNDKVLGASCPGANSNIASGQYAQSGKNATEIKRADGSLGTETQRECVKCQDGEWGGSYICGEGEATSYITRPDEVVDCKNDPVCTLEGRVHASCWRNGTWYSDSSANGTDHCFDGEWKDPAEYKSAMSGADGEKGRCGDLTYNESTFKCEEKISLPGNPNPLSPAQVAKIAECASQNRPAVDITTCGGNPVCESGWQLKSDGSTCIAPPNLDTPEVKNSIEACTKKGRYFDYGTGLCHFYFDALSDIGKANNIRHFTPEEIKKLEKDCHFQHPGYILAPNNTCVAPNRYIDLNTCREGIDDLNSVKVYTTCNYESDNTRGSTTYHFCTAGGGTQEYVQGIGCTNKGNPKNPNGTLTGGEYTIDPSACRYGASKYGATGNVCNYSTGSSTTKPEPVVNGENINTSGTPQINQPKVFGATCYKNSECDSGMCSFKTNTKNGNGWYCMEEINKSDSNLGAGILTDDQGKCKNGGVDTGFVTHNFLKSYPIYQCSAAPVVQTPALDTTPLVPTTQQTQPLFQPGTGTFLSPEDPDNSARVNDVVARPDQCPTKKVAYWGPVGDGQHYFYCMPADFVCKNEDREKSLYCTVSDVNKNPIDVCADNLDKSVMTIPDGKGGCVPAQTQSDSQDNEDLQANNFKYFSQKDVAFVSDQDEKTRMKLSELGCGDSVAAMLIYNYTDDKLNPLETRDKFFTHENYTNSGFYFSAAMLPLSGYGFEFKDISAKVGISPMDELAEATYENPIVLGFDYDGAPHGHYVLAVGKDENGVPLVYDPYHYEDSGNHPPIALTKENFPGMQVDNTDGIDVIIVSPPEN